MRAFVRSIRAATTAAEDLYAGDARRSATSGTPATVLISSGTSTSTEWRSTIIVTIFRRGADISFGQGG